MTASPALQQRIDEIFGAALTYAPAEQAAFLDRACAGDDRLRAEVESLLRHDQQAGAEFLKPPDLPPPAAPPTPTDGPDPLIGQSIGGFEIKRLIAAGGMGTVYEAEQQHPRRTVALKVMHGWAASPAVARRFQLEAEILARLRHPHIAQVYHAGMHELAGVRVPYFAMEYVPHARPITQYADEAGLNTRQRLELFATVCDAVQHGHQRGIIHRDLKPANILVAGDESVAPPCSAGPPSPASRTPTAGAEPGRYRAPRDPAEVKIIDFGVARATDADIAVTTRCTAAGQIVGTVQYMSPEQCDGDSHDIDTRTDVYSLGVVLYELLTGCLPYETSGRTIYAATRTIKEQVPPKPSTRLGRYVVGQASVPAQAGRDASPTGTANTEPGRFAVGQASVPAQAGRDASPTESAGRDAGPTGTANTEPGRFAVGQASVPAQAGRDAGPTESAGRNAGPTRMTDAEAGRYTGETPVPPKTTAGEPPATTRNAKLCFASRSNTGETPVPPPLTAGANAGTNVVGQASVPAPAGRDAGPTESAGRDAGPTGRAAAFMLWFRRTRRSGATGERGPLARELRGDIDTIVMKALEKDREQRYASAADLAADIRRYLNREPIAARPPTRWTRAVRWVQRHPYVTTVSLCLLLAALVLAATSAAVWFVNRRPHRFVLERASGHEEKPYAQAATLQTLGGRSLRTWSGPDWWSVKLAQLVDRPRELGGGKVAVVLFNEQGYYSPFALHIYDTRVSVHDPAWIGELRDGDPLPDPHRRGYTARQFHPQFAQLVDVFPEHPGPELVTGHVASVYSQSVIRIWDLRGEVLYEIWHDGPVAACYWMADAGQLVLTGLNAEVYWEQRGYTGVDRPHARVIYAIRPQYRKPQHAFLSTRPGDGPCDPVWYKCLWPPEIVGSRKHQISVGALNPPIRSERGRSATVVIWCDPGLAFSFEIDERGEIIPDTRVISDEYNRALAAGRTPPGTDPDTRGSPRTGPPDPALITLEDLPLIRPSATRPAPQ